MKRSQGRKKGPKNFRKRFFSLTNTGLSYHKSKGDPPLCSIPPEELLTVERVDDDAFAIKFVSCVCVCVCVCELLVFTWVEDI